MIERDQKPQNTKRQNIVSNILIFFPNSNEQNNGERIHQNSLVPSQNTRRKIHNLAKVKTTQNTYQNQQKRYIQDIIF